MHRRHLDDRPDELTEDNAKKSLLVTTVALGLLGSDKAAAQDGAAGEALYKKQCRSCHGPTAKGMSSYPKFAGQPFEYLVDRLKGYRSAERFGPNTPLMAPRAQALSDDDIVNISQFISTLE